jgi:type II secretory pathway pseudopilin PulG
MLNAIASSVIMPSVLASTAKATAATKKEKKEKVYQRFLDRKSDSHRHLN